MANLNISGERSSESLTIAAVPQVATGKDASILPVPYSVQQQQHLNKNVDEVSRFVYAGHCSYWQPLQRE